MNEFSKAQDIQVYFSCLKGYALIGEPKKVSELKIYSPIALKS